MQGPYIMCCPVATVVNIPFKKGRFKSIIVENDTYLPRLSCYIHRNPIRAGIVERLADYEWSSYGFYAYKNKKVPAWLTC
jgi:putative transposase